MSDETKVIGLNTPGYLPAKQEIDLSPNLSERGKKIVENSQSERCKLLLGSKEGHNRIYQMLSAAIQKAVLVAGFKANTELGKKEKHMVITEMINVVGRYHWLSIADLETVLDYGLSGDFESKENKSYALNARTLNAWINAYHDKYRSPSMTEQAYYIQRQENEEETRKSDLYFDYRKKRNLQMLSSYCQAIRDKKQGKVYETDFGADIDYICIGFFFTFNRFGLFGDCMAEMKRIWQEESHGITHMKSETKLKIQKVCRIRMVRRYLAKLLNENINIEDYLNQQGV